jgi:cell division protein FtsI (penicillin-binding protein 3)
MRQSNQSPHTPLRINRLTVLQAVFLLIGVIFVARLFTLQVLKADHYKQLARGEQFKQLEIEPERGTLYFQNGSDAPVAAVVNESRFTIFADPVYVKEKDSTAQKLSEILASPKDEIKEQLDRDVRYAILAKKVTKDVQQKIEEASLKGVAWREERIRTYPQGALGGHVLGFVNDEGQGQYGVEGALNSELLGVPGQIRAVTDIQGTPLVQNKDNVVKQAVDGTEIVLSIDQSIQRIAEDEIKAGVERSGAKSGSVVVMESDTGRVKAMANFPTYNPAEYVKVTDQSLFKNQAVSDPLEPGSIIKTLLVGAAIDNGTIAKDSTYYDAGVQTIDGVSVRNLTPLSPGSRSVFDILQYSLNTGAIELVKKFGGGEITEQARTTWYRYLSDSYRFTDAPTIELDEASNGFIPSPTKGDGLRVQYANMAFGQGLTMSIQQFASALSAAVNGGTYYQPTVVYSRGTEDGITVQAPKVIKESVISSSASSDLVALMSEYESKRTPNANREGFILGGKTGTAQVAGTDGRYREDIFNATFAGFLGKKRPKYVIVVRLNEGKANDNFSGFEDARPVYLGIASAMMDSVPFTD